MRFAICILMAGVMLSVFARESPVPYSPREKEKEPPKIFKEKDNLKEKERNAKDLKDKEKAEAAPTWKENAVPGAAVTLRVKRNVGKVLVYDGTLERSQNSKNSFHEMNQYYLSVLCAEQVDGLDHVVMHRVYNERKRNEVLENGKPRDALLPNTQEMVNLGADFIPVGAFRCYPIDAQNRLAYRSEQQITLTTGQMVRGKAFTEDAENVTLLTNDDKLVLRRAQISEVVTVPNPHIILNDTQHYLFPLLPERAVSPGETWKFKVPVIIPLNLGTPPRVLPTNFDVVMVARLREVKQSSTGPVAFIDYKVNGGFDSMANDFQSRFNAQFHASNQIIHKLTGDGAMALDITTGRILDKTESFNIMLYGSSMVIPEVDRKDNGKDAKAREPKKDENKAEIFTRLHLRLMMPGERAKTGAVIPAYD